MDGFLETSTLAGFAGGAVVTVLVTWLLLRRNRETWRREAAVAAREIRAKAILDVERQQAEAEKNIEARRARLEEREEDLQRRQQGLRQAEEEMEGLRNRLEETQSRANAEAGEYKNAVQIYRERLRQMGDLSPEEAELALREEIALRHSADLQALRQEILGRSEKEYRLEAQRILVDVMQRMTATPPNEISATLVPIPNEDMKGRLIGREGRNIRAFETASGVTLMIDETPGQILISSFDPVRREIARLALERLIKDGRIHPVSIEETLSEASEEIKANVYAVGERALLKLRLSQVHPEVVALLGKLHYRLSNNQNTLEHSIEVAFFASLVASELGLDPDLAKRCGLFHDLGKAIEHDYEGSHSAAAARMLQRYGEDERVINAVAASHEEVPATSVYAGVLGVADAISAARPGARTDTLDGYLQRIRGLERKARQYRGVKDAYAVQAGREVRVIVEPEELSDHDARQLSRDLRRKIEEELSYPGSIKITVIRETRFAETAN